MLSNSQAAIHMTKCLIELHYLPSIHFFESIAKHPLIIVEKHEHFVKQSYRSRCIIQTSQGPQTLIIPLTGKHSDGGKVPITDVRIDNNQKWLNNHWRSIQSAYAKAPFFEFYADALHTLLFKQHTHLYELNFELLTLCLKWLKLPVRIEESLSYQPVPDEGIIDLRNLISAKNKGISSETPLFKPYTQVFGNAFVNNLSIIDLIFCTGPDALTYLRKAE